MGTFKQNTVRDFQRMNTMTLQLIKMDMEHMWQVFSFEQLRMSLFILQEHSTMPGDPAIRMIIRSLRMYMP